MQYQGGDRSEPDNQRELSDHGAEVARRDQKMDCGKILSDLDWKRLLRSLSKKERYLFKLYYLEQNSPAEIAGLLAEDGEEVERKVNRLRNKIKARARAMVKGTPLEKALNQASILSSDKVAKKELRASAKRATATKKASSSDRAKETRLNQVLQKLGFRLGE